MSAPADTTAVVGPDDTYEAAAAYYDLFAAALGAAARPDVAAFASLARPTDEVLDVGAGTGRVALAVAERGARVWCIEPSAAMRTVLLAKLAARPELWPGVTVLSGAAPNFDLGRRFDYVTLAGVMQFVPSAERPLLFATLHRHLRPAGRLALDMIDTVVEPAWEECEVNAVWVGEWRYSLLAGARVLGPTRSRVTYRYRAERAATSVDQVVERDRHWHLLPDALTDLDAAGFDVAEGTGVPAGVVVCHPRGPA